MSVFRNLRNLLLLSRLLLSHRKFPKPPFVTRLWQNYPNPFNPETWIPYELAEGANVTIKIYNVVGQLVKTLELGHKESGFYTSRDKAAYWGGRNEAGEKVVSGVYFYQLQAGNFTATRKMLMIK